MNYTELLNYKPMRKKSCSVPDCDGKDATIYHKFPSDENLKRKWIESCNITIPITSNYYICGLHFDEADYASLTPRKRLRKDVIPTRNLTHEELNFEEFIPDKEMHIEIKNISDFRTHGLIDINTNADGLNIINSTPQLDETSNNLGKSVLTKTCCVPNCPSKLQDNRVYYSFPKLNKIYQQWITACNLSEPIKQPIFVCSAHFKREDYLDSKKQNLKSDAIPSIYIPKKAKFKVVIKEEEIREKNLTSNKNNEDKEKVTTIIYVPNNCKNIISHNSNNVKIVKTTKITQNSVKTNVTHVLQNLNPMKDLQQDTVSGNKQSNIGVLQSQCTNKDMSKGNSDNEMQITSVHTNKDISLVKKNIVKKQENVNLPIQKQANKNVQLNQSKATNDQQKKNMSAITLCAGCGRYTNIDDDDLYDNKKNLENLAAEILLELQEVNSANEDERTLLTRKGIEICDKIIQKKSFTLISLLQNDTELMAFTGISVKLLDKLTKAVTIVEGPRSMSKSANPAKERIVLCLCKLRTNLPFRCLAVLFGISQQLCSTYFFSMVRTLSRLLQHTIYWSKTEELIKNLPKCFQSFKQTRVILNCTETEIEKQRCLKCKLEMKANKKEYESVKFILGVAPNGLIIFKSNVFDAQASNSSIFSQTTILNDFDPVKEAIMSDNTLDIEAECLEHNITLIKAPKIDKYKPFSSSDVELIKNVCAARIHVDRTLQRFRMYKILQTKISWRILPYIDDVSTIITGIVNMKNSILPDAKHLALAGLYD